MIPWTIQQGHILEVLRAMPDESVHCVVTSPPYWGLRDYGIDPQVWGGDASCKHAWGAMQRGRRKDILPADVTTSTGRIGTNDSQGGAPLNGGNFCQKCGAWKGSYGSEPTPEMYVEHTVQIFREIRRVLRSDGTLWLNMGDCYASKPFYDGDSVDPKWAQARNCGRNNGPNRQPLEGLKPKDMVGMPWRVAFALQADGWWLRQDNVWDKPNPMPKSVQDRCTKAHEYVFLLAKSERYFYDAEAVKEPVTGNAHSRGGGVNPKATRHGMSSRMQVDRDPRHLKYERRRPKQNASFSAAVTDLVTHRNRRSVWRIATQAMDLEMCLSCRTIYDGRDFRRLKKHEHDGKTFRVCQCGISDWLSHFATFPEALVEPCVKAGTSERGCCPSCGAPWQRVVSKIGAKGEKKPEGWDLLPGHHSNTNREYSGKHGKSVERTAGKRILEAMKAGRDAGLDHDSPFARTVTTGWQPTCSCGELDTVPCVVFDPFSGSATVAVVALRLGRSFYGAELNPDYVAMGKHRVLSATPLLACGLEAM